MLPRPRPFSVFFLTVLVLVLCIPSSAFAVDGSCNGYTLYTPLTSPTTYLIDNSGDVVHTWLSQYPPGNSVYLLENRNLLRTLRLPGGAGAPGGVGGGVEERTWDGDPVWFFEHLGDDYIHHHDVERLPNGNVLMIVWRFKTVAQAIAAGRNPAWIQGSEFLSEEIIEVEPTGPTSGNIVWQWNLWDHLIQDFDPTKDNYGVVADHPELLDVNFPPEPTSDWIHMNAIDYNAELDQILVSSPFLNEVWVIDHSTTTAEAAGHTGGNSGRGGDLLYRWGNPLAYGAGTSSDQTLFGQHNVQWIDEGNPGAGNILVFNNGVNRPGGNYSSVDEIVPPVDGAGNYDLTPGSAYGPAAPTWSYTADVPTDFYSSFISGAQRLPNGNTLICSGAHGYFFEVTADKDQVWEYQNEFPSPSQNRVFRAERYDCNLWSDAATLTASTGGSITFSLHAGIANADRKYVLVGCRSGTMPGTLLPGGLATLPLNVDEVTDLIIERLNTPAFTDFAGRLDASGDATAQLNVPAKPGLAGTTLHFAYALRGPWDFASTALTIEVVP